MKKQKTSGNCVITSPPPRFIPRCSELTDPSERRELLESNVHTSLSFTIDTLLRHTVEGVAADAVRDYKAKAIPLIDDFIDEKVHILKASNAMLEKGSLRHFEQTKLDQGKIKKFEGDLEREQAAKKALEGDLEREQAAKKALKGDLRLKRTKKENVGSNERPMPSPRSKTSTTRTPYEASLESKL